jgi:hypothetical protein
LAEGTSAIRPRRDNTNVFGCGLVLDPEDKLCIFFTLNGQLLGEFVLKIFRINKKELYIFPLIKTVTIINDLINLNFLGRKMHISPMVDRLYPTVKMLSFVSSCEANFGDDLTKPFEYDIHNCPGLGLACI